MNSAMVSLNTQTFIFSLIDMDSGESYHSESEFYYPDEMTNSDKKENIGATRNKENQQNVEVFTMANVQNYILAQRAENAVKRNRVLSLFERLEEVFLRNISENREIEKIPADKLNILICRLTMDIKKKDGGAYG